MFWKILNGEKIPRKLTSPYPPFFSGIIRAQQENFPWQRFFGKDVALFPDSEFSYLLLKLVDKVSLDKAIEILLQQAADHRCDLKQAPEGAHGSTSEVTEDEFNLDQLQ